MLHSLGREPGELSSTVRLGRKWAGARTGTPLILCVCKDRCLNNEICDDPPNPSCANCDRQGTGEVSDAWIGRFFEVPAKLIEFEHEERSRTYSGLKASMTKAYGDLFTGMSPVVVLLYRRIT